MKKSNAFLLGMISILLIFGLLLTGCGNGTENGSNNGGGPGGDPGGLAGTWRGYYEGSVVTLMITNTGWTASAPSLGYFDSGTYIMDGITARIISTYILSNIEVGIAVILDSNTISLTLYSFTDAPGTHMLFRQ